MEWDFLIEMLGQLQLHSKLGFYMLHGGGKDATPPHRGIVPNPNIHRAVAIQPALTLSSSITGCFCCLISKSRQSPFHPKIEVGQGAGVDPFATVRALTAIAHKRPFCEAAVQVGDTQYNC